jgi:hypothetical protein
MFTPPTPEHTGSTVDERPPAQSPTDFGWLEADMDNFSAGQAQEPGFDQGAMLAIGDPFDLLHSDDNLGDEAAFPTTWQQMASGDAPRD